MENSNQIQQSKKRQTPSRLRRKEAFLKKLEETGCKSRKELDEFLAKQKEKQEQESTTPVVTTPASPTHTTTTTVVEEAETNEVEFLKVVPPEIQVIAVVPAKQQQQQQAAPKRESVFRRLGLTAQAQQQRSQAETTRQLTTYFQRAVQARQQKQGRSRVKRRARRQLQFWAKARINEARKAARQERQANVRANWDHLHDRPHVSFATYVHPPIEPIDARPPPGMEYRLRRYWGPHDRDCHEQRRTSVYTRIDWSRYNTPEDWKKLSSRDPRLLIRPDYRLPSLEDKTRTPVPVRFNVNIPIYAKPEELKEAEEEIMHKLGTHPSDSLQINASDDIDFEEFD